MYSGHDYIQEAEDRIRGRRVRLICECREVRGERDRDRDREGERNRDRDRDCDRNRERRFECRCREIDR